MGKKEDFQIRLSKKTQVLELEQTMFSQEKLLQKLIKQMTYMVAHINVSKNGHSFKLQEEW